MDILGVACSGNEAVYFNCSPASAFCCLVGFRIASTIYTDGKKTQIGLHVELALKCIISKYCNNYFDQFINLDY